MTTEGESNGPTDDDRRELLAAAAGAMKARERFKRAGAALARHDRKAHKAEERLEDEREKLAGIVDEARRNFHDAERAAHALLAEHERDPGTLPLDELPEYCRRLVKLGAVERELGESQRRRNVAQAAVKDLEAALADLDDRAQHTIRGRPGPTGAAADSPGYRRHRKDLDERLKDARKELADATRATDRAKRRAEAERGKL